MSVPLQSLVAFTNDLLDAPAFADYCPNGLQVEGRAEVRRIVSGVSSSLALFEAAAERDADLVLVHHGLFWKSDWPLRVVGSLRRRLGVLIENGISLLAYHLPLDAHPEVGNNAVAAARLGLLDVEPFGEYNGRAIGRMGRLPEPMSPTDFSAKLAEVYGREPLLLPGGRERIGRVGMISGGAASEYHQAVAQGLDAYITGEPAEWALHTAREEGTHFYACGHYATERLGVQALATRLVREFGIETRFVELQNPV